VIRMVDRQFPRYALEAAVTVRHGDASAGGRTTNLSRGGLCAEVDAAIPSGAQIIVELALIFDEGTTSEWLALPARIAWSTPLDDRFQVGISFRGLSADQAEYLELFLRYLADHAPRPSAESNHDDLFSRRRR